MPQLADLPLETMFAIFREVEPRDLGALCQCSREFHEIISTNYLLFRDVYLQRWDTPAHRPLEVGKHWKQDCETFTKMTSILASESGASKKSELPFLADAVAEFLAAAALRDDVESRNVAVLTEHFDRKANRSAFLFGSSTFARARLYPVSDRALRTASLKSPQNQISAKLHCLYGAPSDKIFGLEGVKIYPFAASKVYDLRNYTQANLWGPFKDDGSEDVDWEKMEAVMIVLGHNIERKRALISGIDWDLWTKPFQGTFPNSYTPQESLLGNIRALSRTKTPSLPAEITTSDDPYGIDGYWMRIVCFVDYHELFAFNFNFDNPPPGEPLIPLDTEEATRIIIMGLEVTEVQQPGPDDGQELPVVHFRGVSRPMLDFWDPNAHAKMRGSVRLTKEGEIRWTTFSVYQGEERWRSEGIQIGGLRSGRGVFGNWFDKNFDPQGPAGPTAFWKISDINKPAKTEGFDGVD